MYYTTMMPTKMMVNNKQSTLVAGVATFVAVLLFLVLLLCSPPSPVFVTATATDALLPFIDGNLLERSPCPLPASSHASEEGENCGCRVGGKNFTKMRKLEEKNVRN